MQLANITTVFVILLENLDWSSVSGSNAPFLINSLLPQYARALNYRNPPGLHPSKPNYIWLEAGADFGIRDDNDPTPASSLATPDHLTTYLNRSGVSWKTYQESISGTECPLVSAYPYRCKHNPFVYFADVTASFQPASAYCLAHVRPLAELGADLAQNRTARYNFVTPNMCNDGHDCALSVADAWLAASLPPIMASRAYLDGGAIFITWDEGAGVSDGPIGMVVVSPWAKKGYANSLAYTHSSTLRTMQDIFQVRPYLNDAANAVNLDDLFEWNGGGGNATTIGSFAPSSSRFAPQPAPGGNAGLGVGLLFMFGVLGAGAFALWRRRRRQQQQQAWEHDALDAAARHQRASAPVEAGRFAVQAV
jgi:hypothetical protein